MFEWGMWNMSDTKRCSGHKGHWECVDEYPDHMVPVSEFNKEKNGQYGLGARCRKCHTYASNINNKSKPRHPVTGQWKHNWKTAYAKSIGGVMYSGDWQSYLDKAEVMWNEKLTLIKKPPKFNQGKYTSPLARAVAKSKIKTDPDVSREGPGFVYVYEDEMKEPGVLKIGSTKYSKGRLSSANTWGAFNCLYERHFSRRFEAEDIVHKSLEYCRIYSDKEWFKISLEGAIEAIETVEIDNVKDVA